MPSAQGDFKLHDRVWVRLFDKHSQNLKLDPTFEPGIIREQKKSPAFKVNRLERSRRKTITLNKTLFKQRHSEHPMDIKIIPVAYYKLAVTSQPEEIEEERSPEATQADQPGPRTRARSKQHQEQVTEAFIQAINTFKHTAIIAHLLHMHENYPS